MKNPFKNILLLIAITVSIENSNAQNYALTNANVLDIESGKINANQTVLTSGGKIEKIDSGVKIPSDYERIDIGGRYVLPGLIDAHTHISSIDAALRALNSGVTTARSASTPAYQDVVLSRDGKKRSISWS